MITPTVVAVFYALLVIATLVAVLFLSWRYNWDKAKYEEANRRRVTHLYQKLKQMEKDREDLCK